MPDEFRPLKIAGRLLYNGGRHRLLKAARRPGCIQALSLEITHHCICKCVMCNIWKIEPESPELSMPEWAKLLEGPCFRDLVELDITGGEPFLKKGLAEFFHDLKSLKKNHLSRLRSIAITTNAILTDRVLSTTEAILKTLEGTGMQLVLACAMDAVDQQHDRIRNYAGAFDKMQTTLRGLMDLRRQHPKLILGLKTTVLPSNVDQLPAIDAFAREHGLFGIISPCIITGGRYLNQDLRQELTFSQSQIDKMISFFGRQDLRWSYHARTLKESLLTGRSRRRCSCGFNYAFIRSTGQVHLCPLLPQPVGSVARDDFAAIWSSAQARQLRGRIGLAETCRNCTEPGLERYSLYYEGWTYLGLLLKMGTRRFAEFHQHMGLGHYFD